MVSRRQVVVAGGSGLAALGLGLHAGRATAGARAPGISMFVYDGAIAGAGDTAHAFAAAGIRTARFRGDIGVPWSDSIEPIWRRQPLPVAGLTQGGAFFCLEQLAASHGLACTFRSATLERAELLSLLRTAATDTVRRAAFRESAFGDAPIAWLFQPVAGTTGPDFEGS
jgi:hypothetical protein